MSSKELRRLELIQKLINASGLVSKKRSKPSNNIIANDDKIKVLAIISECYNDFGPTLAAEKLLQHHHYSFSVENHSQVDGGVCAVDS